MRLIEKIEDFANDVPPTLRANQLVNFQDAQFRYRIVDYRVLFDYNDELNQLEILKVAHRSEVYYWQFNTKFTLYEPISPI